MITLYSKNKCGACQTVKQVLEGNGLVENEHFEYINIDKEENIEQRKHVESLGFTSVPITEYDGIQAIGVDIPNIMSMIEQVKEL